MHQTSSHLLRAQIKHEQRTLERDKAELKRLENAWKSSRTLRQQERRGLHPLAKSIDEDEQNAGEGDPTANEHTTERQTIEQSNTIAGIMASSTNREPIYLSHSDRAPDPDLEALLKQLKNHLHGIQNNTQSMQPVLAAISEARVGLDLFHAAKFDDLGS